MPQPTTRWTVIPRGFSADGKLTFAIVVTPTQLDFGTPTPPVSAADLWVNWLKNCNDAATSSAALVLQVSGLTQKIPMQLGTRKTTITDPDTLWSKLLTYVNSDWMDSSQQNSDGTSAHLQQARNLPMRRTQTRRLMDTLNNVHGASILAMQRRRSEDQGLKGTAQNVLAALNQSLLNTSYAITPALRTDASDQSQKAKDFRDWMKIQLASGDPSERLKARAAERDLYRLADNPYNTLDGDVFGIVMGVANRTPGMRVPVAGASSDRDRADAIEHAIFHRRYQAKPFGDSKSKPQGTPATQAGSAQPVTILDFYRTLSLLSHYPELLTSLGLCYDPAPVDVSSANLNNREFSVAFQAPSSLSPETALLYTACTANGLPGSKSSAAGSTTGTPNYFAIADGYLVLDQCEIVTRDIDGEALRAVQNGSAQRTQQTAPTFNPPTLSAQNDASAPDPYEPDQNHVIPMRTIGISLVHEDAPDQAQASLRRAFDLRDQQRQATQPLAPTDDSVLHLNDLIRGYTVEVAREKNPPLPVSPSTTAAASRAPELNFTSLTSREVTYSLPAAGNAQPQTISNYQAHFPVELSTVVTKDSAVPGDNSGIPDAHQHPALFRWSNWGLTVDTPYPQTQADDTPRPSPKPFPVKTVYTSPSEHENRWERLRFGDRYHLRLRPMDLMCSLMNGVSTDSVTSKNIAACVTYRRSDPVHGPELLVQLSSSLLPPKTAEDCFPPDLPGESLGCIVLRDNQSQPHTSRVLVPPVAALDLLAQHGVLDEGDGFKKLGDIGSFHDVALMADGSFPVVKDAPKKTKNKSAKKKTDPPPDSKNLIPVYTKATDRPPSRTYLPDPMAEHVAVEMIDLSDPDANFIGGAKLFGTADERFHRGNFYKDEDGYTRQWPNAVRLAVQMEQALHSDRVSAFWQEDKKTGVTTLHVGVPAGWQARLLLKCVPKQKHASAYFDLPHTTSKANKDIARWLVRNKLLSGQQDQLAAQLSSADDLAQKLAAGHLDAATPPVEVLLVHAVKKPTVASVIDRKTGVTVQQHYDSPKAEITITANVGHRRSTGKVELIAEWQDIIDAPPSDYNTKSPQTVHVQQWPLSLQGAKDPKNDQQTFTNVSQTFPDTSYRRLKLSVNAISRFENLYAPDSSGKPGDESPFTLKAEDKDKVQVTLQNTGRLAAPRLNRVIPLRPRFWDTYEGGVSCCTHYGGAFRIYLERPWQGVEVKDGGQGELLGITLWGEQFEAPPKPRYDSAANFEPVNYKSYSGDTSLEPYVTRWGADPGLSNTVLPSLAPVSTQFFHPRTAKDGLKQAEIAKCSFPVDLPLANDTSPQLCDPMQIPYFTIAKYPVHWDDTQEYWYADVQLTGIRSGFVRFGLTRYQPISLVNREASSVTMTPLTPIPAHRELYFRREDHHMVTLQICGTPQEPNATGAGRHFEIELHYHRLDPFPSHQDRWVRAEDDQQPQEIKGPKLYAGTQYPILKTYRLNTKPLGLIPLPHKYRLVVREFETLFADTPGQRDLHTTEQRLVDTIIEDVP